MSYERSVTAIFDLAREGAEAIRDESLVDELEYLYGNDYDRKLIQLVEDALYDFPSEIRHHIQLLLDNNIYLNKA